VLLRNFTKVVCMQRARADSRERAGGGNRQEFLFVFLSYMWRSSVDRDRSRSCLGAGGAAVRWRALLRIWHRHVVVVHQYSARRQWCIEDLRCSSSSSRLLTPRSLDLTSSFALLLANTRAQARIAAEDLICYTMPRALACGVPLPKCSQIGGLGALRSADFLPRGLVVLA